MDQKPFEEIMEQQEEIVESIEVIKQNRFKSRAAWVSIGALILLFGNAFKVWDLIGITNDFAQGAINFVLAVLTAFGVFNDPTSRNQF